MTTVLLVIALPIVFVLVAVYVAIKLIVLMLRLCFLPVTLLLVLARR